VLIATLFAQPRLHRLQVRTLLAGQRRGIRVGWRRYCKKVDSDERLRMRLRKP
jgi:hypothetical protein